SVTTPGATVVAPQPPDLRTHLRVRVLDPVGMIRAVRRRRRTGKGVLGRGVRGRGESLVDGLHGPADSSAKGEPGRQLVDATGLRPRQLGGRSLNARS